MPKQEKPKIEYEGRTRAEKRKEEGAVKEEKIEEVSEEEIEEQEAEIEAEDKRKIKETRKELKDELTPEEREIIEEEKEKIEEAMEKMREMENWKELQRNGLLTEKAEEIFNNLEGVILEIDQKYKMLTMAKENAERFKIRIEKGEFDKGGIRRIPEEKWQNPLIDLEEREKEMKKLEENYNQLKEELQELERRGELVKKTESEKDEEKISGEETGIPEGKEKEEEEKGRLGIIKRLFGRK
ncbi:hypothetical protein KAT95_01120 [Candidatus Parcubacteria bacterium]|nr:hypothetical protein [Candidatus Parcubacteria bacterium]